MTVYRISKKLYINDLQGTGCKFDSGRWHQVGTQIVYSSETVSLAKLEILANANRLPIDMYLAYIEIPESYKIEELNTKLLPPDWDRTPYPNKLTEIVKLWKQKNTSIALKVPSVHSPTEKNILLNPDFAQYNEVKVLKIEPIGFDGRFFK